MRKSDKHSETKELQIEEYSPYCTRKFFCNERPVSKFVSVAVVIILKSFWQCNWLDYKQEKFSDSWSCVVNEQLFYRLYAAGSGIEASVLRGVCVPYKCYYYYYFLNLGRSSRGGRQKLILEIITLMVNHPSGSHQQSSRAAG